MSSSGELPASLLRRLAFSNVNHDDTDPDDLVFQPDWVMARQPMTRLYRLGR